MIKIIKKVSPLILIIFTIHISIGGTSVLAESQGVSISPPNIRISAGQSYKVKVSNHNNEVFTGSVSPAIFQLEGENSVRPLNDGEVSELGINLNEYITFDKTSFSIEPNESEELTVSYDQSFSGYFLGIDVKQEAGSEENISVSTILSTYIVDFDLSEDEIRSQIEPSIEIKPKSSILGLGIGNQYEIILSFKNSGEHKVIGSGYVEISKSDPEKVKIDQFTITPDLIDGIFPGDSVSIKKEFVDTRDIFNRRGDLEALIKLDIEGTNLVITDTTSVSIAVEHVFILIFILSIGLSMGFFFYKQKSKLNFKKSIG